MDRAGRVVVAKELRDRLGLPQGGPVEIVEVDGHLILRPVLAEVVVSEADGFPVVRFPGASGPVLTDDVVRDTLELIRP